MRSQPVTFVPEIECWLVTRYDDIVQRRPPIPRCSPRSCRPVRSSPASRRAAVDGPPRRGPELAAKLGTLRGGTRVLLSADPPDHQRQRRLVNRAFTPPKVKALEPRIREVAERLVDGFVGRRPGRARRTSTACCSRSRSSPSASAWPTTSCPSSSSGPTTSWPPSATTTCPRSSSAPCCCRSSSSSSTSATRSSSAGPSPSDDLISDVVHAPLDGEPLPDDEMLAMFNQFLVAGNETTTKLLASSVLLLLQRPELQDRAPRRPVADPGLRRGGAAARTARAGPVPHGGRRHRGRRRADPGRLAPHARLRRRQPRRAEVRRRRVDRRRAGATP